MYSGSITTVMCVVGVTELFQVEVGMHQGSNPSEHFLFAIGIDRLAEKVIDHDVCG